MKAAPLVHLPTPALFLAFCFTKCSTEDTRSVEVCGPIFGTRLSVHDGMLLAALEMLGAKALTVSEVLCGHILPLYESVNLEPRYETTHLVTHL